MKNKWLCLFCGFFFALQGISGQEKTLKMWYDKPADDWMKSLPIGNGRLGGMVFGGVAEERIAFNEITLWSGQKDPNQETFLGKEALREIQQLFLNGKVDEGNALASKKMVGKRNSFGSHVPFGDIELVFGKSDEPIHNYVRMLDLAKGVVTVIYEQNGITYDREYFCSNPAGVLVIRLTASEKGKQNFEVRLNPLRESVVTTENNTICFTGQATFPYFGPGGVRFYGGIKVLSTGGKVKQCKESLLVEKSDEVILIADLRTDFVQGDMKEAALSTLNSAAGKNYETLKQEHMTDFGCLFNRVNLSLGKGEEDMATDKRLMRMKEGHDDPDLVALFFHYGRYLLISSSRENSPLPANLQGLWNDNLACNMQWSCDYHLDINTQQNYWAANICNLRECNIPLFNYVETLVESGSKTAEKVYGCDGWVAHTIANVWGFTAPGWNAGWGLHPTGGAWLASHLWDYYNFTNDRQFLRRAYPVLKQASLFLLDYMIEDPSTGYLLTGPSASPENYFMWHGKRLALSMMPTCDRVIVYEILNACLNASELLQVDKKLRERIISGIQKLPPFKIGKYGQLQEWLDDYEEAVPNHRHTSHLLALYPYSQISLDKTPELANAATVSISRRLAAKNWEDVEWSRANMVNFFARLKDSQKAYESILCLINDLSRENMLTISPKGIAGAPTDIFIFDGNEAGAAGIAEMLLQSHEEYVELLPCLPDQWTSGNYKGLCARGGFEVNLSWSNKIVKHVSVSATVSNTLKLKLPERSGHEKYYKNKRIIAPIIRSNNVVHIDMQKGDVFEVKYN
ncbi:glycoside hydrolase N-terminal domain-containing protein [uncultured Parabacteroides sp.]|jgi:alpha-L-fucosidase 2|uniref:glycoside hydrolase family 95 protein n=1 Tax=uncultured Parabacteroides sp. TaxID=512312 RepID=UPI0025DF3F47|nr:glycoside hydrolase N-terminal domain-containing protein [uncultured Parabacteroides sp.]